MTQPNILQTILQGSRYRLSLFREDEIAALAGRVVFKTRRGQEIPYVPCAIRGREVQLRPEEVVRQLYAARLLERYGYPVERLACEFPVHFGREVKQADIVIRDQDRPDSAYAIVELKKPRLSDGKGQLRSYCNATGAPIGVWTNGQQISHYHRKDPNYFEDLSDLPQAGQTLADIINERFTLKDLILKDKLANERKSLKDLILELEDEVLANAGVDVFEEVFKLIFAKLYDEFLSRDDKEFLNRTVQQTTATGVAEERALYQGGQDYAAVQAAVGSVDAAGFRALEFRNTGQTDSELKRKLQGLFARAVRQWPGVFPEGAAFELSDSHLAVCVSGLQDVKLFNSNLLVVDEAFEYLVNKSAKGEKGQYFTPRHVIDMCVKMLNPQRGEYMIDTASGSCGFPVHTIFHLTGRLFSNAEIPAEDKEDALRVFGIDFDEKTVRVARTLNLIAGDGETNVLHLNALDYQRWEERTEDRRWFRNYGDGFERLERLRAEPGQNKRFQFDIVMANPPFAGDIKESRILHQYEIARQSGQRAYDRSRVGRDLLFIERNLDFLKPGGRMAIILPQGRLNNATDKQVREFIAERARIIAVIGLHPNTFKPHTGTKTSVLLLQKWNEDRNLGKLCTRQSADPGGNGDYPIFMAVSERGGKDNSGEYIYREGLDQNGHLIVDHDLHNHGGALEDGIAEEFIQWAKKQVLSFRRLPRLSPEERERRGAAWGRFIDLCVNDPIRPPEGTPPVDVNEIIDQMYDDLCNRIMGIEPEEWE